MNRENKPDFDNNTETANYKQLQNCVTKYGNEYT